MTASELSGGLPRPWLKTHERNSQRQTLYGNFAFGVLQELEHKIHNLPDDILTIGDNWFQLVVTFNTPQDDIQAYTQTTLGAQKFANMWPIMDRKDSTLTHMLYEINEGVHAGSIDPRILEEIAVLDRTSPGNEPFDEASLAGSESHPWGQIVQLRDTKTNIFHITGGYSRKIIEDLEGSRPGDDLSGVIFLNEN